SDLLYDTRRIIEFVSGFVTLEPGDVIMTGTPGSPGDIKPGDTVDVELEGVGVLTTPITAGK
ncbi:MAG: fumarylacetoacetate hydrolase family protein, partial [Chloroflexi bacterium]|nr:fumarylacetoacetate hydrolase family protein [Chloroflexota bacterium]